MPVHVLTPGFLSPFIRLAQLLLSRPPCCKPCGAHLLQTTPQSTAEHALLPTTPTSSLCRCPVQTVAILTLTPAVRACSAVHSDTDTSSDTACCAVQSYAKQQGKMGPPFGHAGMVLSAATILKDMEQHGVLETLFHGAEYKDQE